MPSKQNLIGQKFNRLTVIDFAESRNKKTYWKCECDCGKIVEIRADQLKNNNTKSCGCLNNEIRSKLGKSHIQNLEGKKFGHLTPIRRLDYRKNTSVGYSWECLCDCGNIINVSINDLKSGNTSSCGCEKESSGEKNIALFLISLNIPFETQKKFNNLYNQNKNKQLKFDFYLPNENILIEFDGPQHYKNTNYTTENGLVNDQIKNQWCINNQINLFRIPYEEKNYILNYNNLFDLCKKQYLVTHVDHYNLGIKI